MVARGYDLLADYAAADRHPGGAHRGAVGRVERRGTRGAARPAGQGRPTTATPHCEIVDADEVYRQVPALGDGALGRPDRARRIDHLHLDHQPGAGHRRRRAGASRCAPAPAPSRSPSKPTARFCTPARGDITTSWVVNAAGLGATTSIRRSATTGFTSPRAAANCWSTTNWPAPLIDKIVLPVPTSRGKGVLVSPTIYGNVMLGPTAEDLDDRSATGTSEAGFEFLLGKGANLMPRLLEEEVTATYAGLRAATDHGDYLIEVDTEQRYVLVGGIRSTGLTSGMAVAEYLDELLRRPGPRPPPAHGSAGPAADAQHR